MDLQTATTLGLGTATITLALAAGHCINKSMGEASHGTFKKALLWALGFGASAHAALYAGILTLAKGIGTL